MAVQLRRLRNGKHPQSRQLLGPPKAVSLDRSQGELNSGEQANENEEEQPRPAIAQDGTEFTEAFVRRGKRHTDNTATTFIRHSTPVGAVKPPFLTRYS